ncbi:MAG: hydrogenase maturation protease [Chloroflexi bacterium]|nr:hydrogenase maturation protease [Chloroflexota bacterium]
MKETGVKAPRILVIGLGNDLRGDDAVGRLLARRLKTEAGSAFRVLEASGEGASLMEAWQGTDAVILIDAVQSGAEPGTIHRLDAHAQPLPGRFFHYSTHAFNVAEAVELARALGQLPPQLVVYGIEGGNFAAGTGLSPEVALAAAEVERRVRREIKRVRKFRTAGSSSSSSSSSKIKAPSRTRTTTKTMPGTDFADTRRDRKTP